MTRAVVQTLEPKTRRRFRPDRWWRVVDFRIGIIPLPVYVILLAIITGFTITGKVPSDILMATVLLSMGGFTCAELGKRLPIARNVGAAAIFATFVPSFLAFHHLLPDPILHAVTEFTNFSNFLYLFIASIRSSSSWSPSWRAEWAKAPSRCRSATWS